MLAERKWFDASVTFPFSKAAPKVMFNTGGGLVTLLGRLGEQLHDDRETAVGTVSNRSLGGTGWRAIWQCTHSIGSDAVKGSAPVSI